MAKALGAGPQNGDHLNPDGGGVAATPLPSISLPGSQNPSILYQHIHEIANKRISTLDYFRKACVTRLFLITVAVSLLNFLVHGTDFRAATKEASSGSTLYISLAQISQNFQLSLPRNSPVGQQTISFWVSPYLPYLTCTSRKAIPAPLLLQMPLQHSTFSGASTLY
jgi:hypothetical protein